MDRDANYVAVGAFVLLVIAMGVGFVLWYTDSGDRRDYQRHEIYFRGTVSGLSEGAPVRYLGVAVGRVARMRIDSRDPSRVQVLADIADSTPIDEGTVARLTLQGVTGLLFIDLGPARAGRQTLAPVASERYPVIASEQSDFDQFVEGLPNLVQRAIGVMDRVERLMSDDNLAAIASTARNLDESTREMTPALRDARAMMAELKVASADVRAMSAEARQLVGDGAPELRESLRRIREVADNLATATAKLDAFVAANAENVTRFTDGGLGELEALIRDARRAAAEFRQLSQSLRQDPSQLLYQPVPRGVEVPR